MGDLDVSGYTLSDLKTEGSSALPKNIGLKRILVPRKLNTFVSDDFLPKYEI